MEDNIPIRPDRSLLICRQTSIKWSFYKMWSSKKITQVDWDWVIHGIWVVSKTDNNLSKLIIAETNILFILIPSTIAEPAILSIIKYS